MKKKEPKRKVLFGLFVFPLLIALTMVILLGSIVFLTHEEDTPESMITAIKTGSPSKRWQKAFELSNELNTNPELIRSEGLRNEMIHILKESSHYDGKTRGFIAMALRHFNHPNVIEVLTLSLKDPVEDVQIYSLWSLGHLKSYESTPQILPLLQNESPDIRKMAVYVLGVLKNQSNRSHIRPLLSDDVLDVRWNAALSLAQLGNDDGIEILLSMLNRTQLENEYELDEQTIEIAMVNAIKGLSHISSAKKYDIVSQLSLNDPNLKVREAAIKYLAKDK